MFDTIGCDPEVFLRDKITKQYIPAVGLIGGTKEEPLMLDENGYFIQEDNVMVEWNQPPASNKAEFIKHVLKAIELVKNKIPTNLEIDIVASAMFEPTLLESPQAKLFGCDPDYDAYEGRANNISCKAAKHNFRSCGGHLHFGYEDPSRDTNRLLAKLLDVFIGVPSVIIDPDKERKKLYGKAGAYRDTNYGVEYRTLSNFWLRSKELMSYVYDQAILAFEHVNKYPDIDEQLVRATINAGDTEMAERICKQLNLNYELR